jgi:hypothetical protein
VRRWITDPPPWAEVHQTTHSHEHPMETLEAGEEDAIALAIELHADLIPMDDREGVLNRPDQRTSGGRHSRRSFHGRYKWPCRSGRGL